MVGWNVYTSPFLHLHVSAKYFTPFAGSVQEEKIPEPIQTIHLWI